MWPFSNIAETDQEYAKAVNRVIVEIGPDADEYKLN
jgi:hypothetical protein